MNLHAPLYILIIEKQEFNLLLKGEKMSIERIEQIVNEEPSVELANQRLER